MAFEIKTRSDSIYFCALRELTVNDIPAFAEQVLPLLFDESQELGLTITGPTEFFYLNSSGDQDTPFQLIIGFPVEEKLKESEQFLYMEEAPFHCASLEYNGSMEYIGDAWCELIGEVQDGGYLITNLGREVYTSWVSPESEDNVIELQIGLCLQISI